MLIIAGFVTLTRRSRIRTMADCKGSQPVAAKVDGEMKGFISSEAEEMGLYQSDVVREALVQYRILRRCDFDCPHCKNPIELQP